jgi:hypothetical protein
VGVDAQNGRSTAGFQMDLAGGIDGVCRDVLRIFGPYRCGTWVIAKLIVVAINKHGIWGAVPVVFERFVWALITTSVWD